MSKIVAIDFGLKRSGIAISDENRIVASPHDVVDSKKLMDYLNQLLEKEKASIIVLGYPTRLDGSDSHITENVRLLKIELEKRFKNVKIDFQDERFTSAQAHQTIHLAGKKSQHKNKGLIDKISASLILQDYLLTLKKD